MKSLLKGGGGGQGSSWSQRSGEGKGGHSEREMAGGTGYFQLLGEKEQLPPPTSHLPGGIILSF